MQKKLNINFTVALILTLFVFGRIAVGIALHPLRIGHDQALHLYIASQLIKGALPFVDVFDTNPPLIYYIDSIPAFVSAIFHVHLITAFSVFILALAILSCLWFTSLLLRYATTAEKSIICWCVLGLACFSAKLFEEYSQREHILLICLFPFILLRWLRYTGRNPGPIEAILVGSFAAIGMNLKPYFFLPILLCESYWFLRLSNWRHIVVPEIISIAAVTALYLLHFFFLPTAMRDGFFGLVIPLVFHGYYWYDSNLIYMLSFPLRKFVTVSILLSCVMGLALYRKTSFAITVVLITLGCFVAFLIQHKGWNYQLEAAWGCAFLLMGLSVGVFLQSLQKHFPNQSTLILLIAPGAAFFILSWNTYRSMDQSLFYQPVHLRSDGYDGTISMREIGPLAQVLLTYTKPGDKLLYLGNCGPEFPACIQLQLGQGSRFSEDTMLALSECLRTDKNIHSSAYQKRIIESYNADVQERRPKLILIQTKWTKNWLAPYDIPGKWLAEYERKPDYGEKYEVYLRKQLR